MSQTVEGVFLIQSAKKGKLEQTASARDPVCEVMPAAL